MSSNVCFDRNADILEMRDVAAHRAYIHFQPFGQFWTSDRWSGLQQFEHGQDATGGMVHDNTLLSVIFIIVFFKRGSILSSFKGKLYRVDTSSTIRIAGSIPDVEQKGKRVEQHAFTAYLSSQQRAQRRNAT
jgi:hypothetical protein